MLEEQAPGETLRVQPGPGLLKNSGRHDITYPGLGFHVEMTSRTDPFHGQCLLNCSSLRLMLAQEATEEAGAVMNPPGGVGVTLMLKE